MEEKMNKSWKASLAAVLSFSMVACGSKTGTDSKAGEEKKTDMSVAMITDSGDITDQSFNQTTYEAAKAWAEENGVKFNYYKPAGDNTTD